MAGRLLQLDDVRHTDSPEKIAFLFQKLGYNATSRQLPIDDLELSTRSAEAIWNAYMIADHQKGSESLQILLFHLKDKEWESPSVASNRMRSLAQSLCRRPSNFLLLGTKDYNQMMLINPRKTFDADMNLKVNIRKLLIDRINPTNYDRDRLEAIAARDLNPQELYKVQCEAFDVEKLTKEFYRGYREIFEEVQRVIKANNSHPYFEDKSRLHQFSQRFLGRVMFMYFLQKKGFLGGDRNFLRTWFPKRSELEDSDFYTGILEPVFFETLNKQRPNHESPWGQIPYLNGGLFDRDYGVDVKDVLGLETPPQIQLPNSLFDPSGDEKKSILKFFNGYNFTIAENVQGDEEAAVDPEMLGKVFENLLAADERGQSGTFYTPRGIVHFMCVESLSRYLADSTGMDVEAIKQLIEANLDLPDTDFNKLLTKEQAKKLKQALVNVKICDPAVGSGAFPLGMMQVMLVVRQAIARREGMTVQRGSLTISKWKRDIIANNLYGVDIKPEAIEIAKLRMWLSMVVDIPTIDNVEPLPNLDYKLMCGDSLISTINGEKLIPDPTKDKQQLELNVTPIQAAIQPVVDLQHQYFTSHADERKALREKIVEAEKNVFRVAIADRRSFWFGKQQELEDKIKLMKGKVNKAQEKERQQIADKLAQLNKFAAEVEKGMRSLNFFQWHLHFNEVFQQQNGFSILIGNPPYVRQEQIKELKPALQAEYECYTGVADLFVYFYERGFNLLKSGGYLSYITSNKYFRAGYGEKLRQFLGEKSKVDVLIDFGDAPVFEAIAYPSIILASKSKPNNQQARVLNWEAGKTVDELTSVYENQSFYMPQKELGVDGWRLESPAVLRLLDKLRGAGTPLGKYVNGRFYYGIKTGLNEAFVIDRETRDRLIAEHESSAEVLKPFLRGRDVKRWCVDYQDLWLIFTRRGIDITKYPTIYEHLLQYKEQLTPGIKGGRKGGSYQWYEIQDNIAYYQEFETPKILYQEIATYQAFAWDNTHAYSNNKTFLIPNANFYLLSLLNSKIVWFFLSYIASKLQGGAYAMQTPYVTQIPIPTTSEPDQLAIEVLVQKCLDAQGRGIEEWEAEIDERVAHLYGLTAEEMKIIRGE